jgi:MarR family transcriptional regulator for hemolysin
MYVGALTRRLEHLDIERHFSILILIEESNGECCQQYISDYLRIDKASMVRIIDLLVEKDFIRRVVNPDDRRQHLLRLTEKAVKTLPEIHAAVDGLNAAAMAGLDRQQIEDFYVYTNHIVRNLENLPANHIIIKYKTAK